MSAEELRGGPQRGAARRGKVGSVARHTGTFDENSFHSNIHSAPRKAGVSKEAKMDEKFEPVIQPYLYKIEITTMRNSIVFGRLKQLLFFQRCPNEYQRINNADSVFSCNFASFKVHVL